MWKIWAGIAAVLTIALLVSIEIFEITDDTASQKELMYQRACSNAMSERFHTKPDRIKGYANGAGGYTVLVNIDEGPDLVTGEFATPQPVVWGAECGFDKDGNVFFLGSYDMLRQEFMIWTEPTGWQQIGKKRSSVKEKDMTV